DRTADKRFGNKVDPGERRVSRLNRQRRGDWLWWERQHVTDRDVLGQNQSEARGSAVAGRIGSVKRAKVIARPTDRIEDRLARCQESEPIGPSVIVRTAIGILSSQMQPVRGAVRGARAPLVRAVLADEHPSVQGMIVWREPDGVTIPVPPREGLDRIRRIRGLKLGTQDRAVADAFVHRAVEGFHRRTWTLDAERGIAARFLSSAGIEHVLAQHDVLTWNVLLVRAVAVVATDDAAIGRRPLRPVDPFVVERELLGRMVTRWQSHNERGDRSKLRVDDHYAGAVV